MLRYENKKTGSLLNIPDEQTISDINDLAYLIKMAIWNDERVMKNNITRLATALSNVQSVKNHREQEVQRSEQMQREMQRNKKENRQYKWVR